MKEKNSGFTLIELMIVVAIIGILAAIAIPRFADMIRKSHEGKAKGSLGAMRSAITLYYSEMEAIYPSTATEISSASGPFLTKYTDRIPTLKLGLPASAGHNESAIVDNYTNEATSEATGTPGQWLYRGSDGLFMIGCSHTDTKSVVISAW